MVPAIAAAQARRFLARRHLLAPPRALPADPASVFTVARRFGSLQFDPLAAEGFLDGLGAALEAWRRFVDADAVGLPRTRVGRALAAAMAP